MKPFELAAARRLLFFSPPEASALISHTSEQAWRRWESGARKVPEDVENKIISLIEWRRTAIGETVKKIRAAPKKDAISLVWYASINDWETLPGREAHLWRPHQSVCAAVFAEFPGQLRFVRFDAPAYSVWLAGRKDSELLRGQWACLM
ncbi:Protein of unknown function DUF1870 [uncultured Caudovirales phage]|uniref:DUF1870 family protein n=1 Tax=uncultured Caudovirales phage TaxID=2100421 RepID=A0A6J5M0L7_9CAUD|nr:Protein of unknown function DUF1870 [uncultured Caudovirales phage]CAB4218400.1 Protein of unknown function DUF1870 [uncultured Caudovirales phage]